MFKGITALYVEDEEAIRGAIGGLLKTLFKDFIVCENGLEGLKAFQANENLIDVIITDINMPKLNGLDMLDKIKEISPFVPMLITTAHNDANFLHRAIDIGVTGYINKPIDVRKLLDVIKKNVLPIIEKKRLEEEISQQREKELHNAKFLAIGQLTAGITHEINTPLTYIKATFEMMQYDIDVIEDKELKNRMNDDVKTILDGIHRIENIISSMKEIASQTKIDKEPASIYKTIMVALTMTYNKCKHISNVYLNGKPYTTNSEHDSNQFMANIQVQRIEQVWIVIINNAMDELIKKGDFSQRKLLIDIQSDDKNITVRFKDNAGGIREDIINNIFDPFKSTKESSGMGVGLNIAKKIVDENNGTIKAYNEDGGAIFEIILPIITS
ncbi:MAG: hybrid sensor histidine kinase/response regulator [Arcobacteraceae bacterium]|nr:hybrid sensor histidine kinase/response regulator [Arcobacteraceae bacterium]